MRFLKKIGLLILAAVTVLLLCTSCEGNSYDGTAQAYLNAFSSFDYKTMYDLLTPGSQNSVSYEEFTEYHKKVYDMLKIRTVKVTMGAVSEKANERIYAYTAEFTSSEYGTFTYEMNLDVYQKTKFYLVAWTPANVVPDMQWNDRIYQTSVKGKRGEIFDRDGRVLVKNDYAITVYTDKTKVKDDEETIIGTARILNMDSETVRKQYHGSYGNTGILATMFKGELTQEQEEALLELDEVKIDRTSITPIRYYPYRDALAQTLGYSSPITEEDRSKPEYEFLPEGTRIGRSGLELAFDAYLRPESGQQIYLLSDDSKRKTVLYQKDAKDGYDLKLTVDILYQKSAMDYMNEHYKKESTGTANVVDPQTGAVVMLVSYPSYDANCYAFDKARGIDKLLADETLPLLNRNVQGTYPPGSIFKSMMALIGIDSKAVSTSTVFPYEKEIEYYTYEKDRWRPSGSQWSNYIVRQAFRGSASGSLNMTRALTWSDNIYFGWLAMKVGKENMFKYADKLGIGDPFPFDLPVKRAQLCNQEATLNSSKLLADTGFGQAEMLFTPLQLCCSFSLYGNSGTIMAPYIVSDICSTNENGELVSVKHHEPQVFKQNVFPESTVLTVRSILENTAKAGTGKNGCNSVIKKARIAAKTGTAQTGTTETGEVGWFAALVIDGGEQDAVLVSADESTLKFAFTNHVLQLLVNGDVTQED